MNTQTLSSNKSRKKGGFLLYFSSFIILTLVSIVIYKLYYVYINYREVNKYTEVSKNKYEDLLNRRKMVQEQINILNTPIGKEIEFRNRYGLGLEGERVYVFVEN